MSDDVVTPLRRLVARALWDGDEARYAHWRLEGYRIPPAAASLLAILADVPNDEDRPAAIRARARLEGRSRDLHRLSLVPLEALGDESIEALVVTVRESLATPFGFSPDELLAAVGPDWSAMSPRERVRYGPHDVDTPSEQASPDFGPVDLEALERRVRAYIAKLPRRGHGQSQTAFRLAAFLTHDLAIPACEARPWMSAWNVSHEAPLSDDALEAAFAAGVRHGRNPVGAGLARAG